MARPKTHKFALQTKGLTDEQAAQVAYLAWCAAYTIAGDCEIATNVPVKVLEAEFPDADWAPASDAYRRSLVQ